MAMVHRFEAVSALNKVGSLSELPALNEVGPLSGALAPNKCHDVSNAPLVITSGVYQIRDGRPVLVRPFARSAIHPAAPEGGAA